MLVRLMTRVYSKLNAAIYRLSKGKILATGGDLPILLLTTTGRKSGKGRTAPLLYVQDGDAYVVIASYGGQPNDPAWYLNLMAKPEATVQIGSTMTPVRADVVDGDDRARLWQAAARGYPSYDKYKSKTDRTIPVVALRPKATAGREGR